MSVARQRSCRCIVYLTTGVEEWVVAVVENRASTEDSLVTREAPVNGGVDRGPLRKGESV